MIIPALSLHAVFKRVLQQQGEGEALQAIAVMHQGVVVDLEATLALNAAKASVELGLPKADSIMSVTARQYGATLWTQDADFTNCEGVQYIRKP